MRAKLSVIMPTLNAEAGLQRALPALAEGLNSGLIRELVITDGGSDDATLRIADAAGAVTVSGPASRGGQLRRGAETASGAWYLFLHADTVLPDSWSDVVQAHISHATSAAVFRLGFDIDGFAPSVVAGWANLRTRVFGLPYGDQALLITRDMYHSLGGFEDIPLMEDVAMARRLRRNIKVLPLTVLSSAEKYRQHGWLKRGSTNLLTLARYFAGADPVKLAARYSRQPAKENQPDIGSHPS